MSPLTLAQLAISRISHDLITPVGAIANGLELIDFTGNDNENQEEVVQLLERSLEAATVKLAYFRSCYGANKSLLKTQDQPFKICKDLLRLKNITLKWQESNLEDKSEASTWRRLAMVLTGLMEEFMPRGGAVVVILSVEEEGICLNITGEGPMILPRPEILAVIEQSEEPSLSDATPMTLPGIIAQYLLQDLQAKAKIDHQGSNNRLEITVKTEPK